VSISLRSSGSYEGIIRSHFAVDAEGKLVEAELEVQPLTTADLVLKLMSI
jgi:peroxiredoxin